MLKCALCGPVSRNVVDFEVSYGAADQLLRVCRWCVQDLNLLGFRSNQVVRLPRVLVPRLSLIEVLGPVGSLVVAGWKVSGVARRKITNVGSGARRKVNKFSPAVAMPCACDGGSCTVYPSASPIHESATANALREVSTCLL